MYFVALSVLAAVSWLLWSRIGSRHRVDVLTAVSSGAAVMSLVDSLYSYFGGEDPVGFSTDSLVLSLVLVLAAIAIWLVVLAVTRK